MKKMSVIDMPDSKTVVSHLKIMHTWASFALEKGPGFLNEQHMQDMVEWTKEATAKVQELEAIFQHHESTVAKYLRKIDRLLAVPEEQRPAVPAEIEGGGSTWWYVCGECHTAIDSRDKYCRECGRKVYWL